MGAPPSGWLPPCSQGPGVGQSCFSHSRPLCGCHCPAVTWKLLQQGRARASDFLRHFPRLQAPRRVKRGAFGTILCLLDGKLQLPPQGRPAFLAQTGTLPHSPLGPPCCFSCLFLGMDPPSLAQTHPVLQSLALGPRLQSMGEGVWFTEQQPSPHLPTRPLARLSGQIPAGRLT